MPETADGQQGWTTTALEELRSNLEYARDLVRGGRFLESLKVGAFDVADLYRAAWVQAVSALDHWVHRELYERALAFALNVEAPRPPRFLKLEVPMQLFEDVHHHAGDFRAAFEGYLRTKFGYQSFQAPEKIKQALSYVSEEPLWPGVAKRLTAAGSATTRDSVVDCLVDIVERRNKIAHEADRDPEDGTARRAITHHDVTLTIDQIDRIAFAIADVLGAPPPAPTSPSRAVLPAAASPKQELYLRFWSQFKEVVERQGWTKAQPQAQNWWNMPGGVTGTTWALSFSRFGCRSELYFEHPNRPPTSGAGVSSPTAAWRSRRGSVLT